MILIYKPKHPRANSNGLVDRNLVQYERGAAPSVIRDEMDATRHMCDNRMYTSKAKFRDVTRAHGCIEVGNELGTLTKRRKPIPLSREKRRDDIRRTIYDLRNGIKRL